MVFLDFGFAPTRGEDWSKFFLHHSRGGGCGGAGVLGNGHDLMINGHAMKFASPKISSQHGFLMEFTLSPPIATHQLFLAYSLYPRVTNEARCLHCTTCVTGSMSYLHLPCCLHSRPCQPCKSLIFFLVVGQVYPFFFLA